MFTGHKYLDDIMADIFGDSFSPQNSLVSGVFKIEQKDGITFKFDVPGCTRESVNITHEGQNICVSAKRVDVTGTKEITKRWYAGDYDMSTAVAKVTNGVLTITLKTYSDQKSNQIKVE